MGKGVHDTCECTCVDICHAQTDIVGPSTIKCSAANYSIFHGLITMWTSILCPKLVLSLFHAKACLEGDCQNCGIRTFKVCLEELQS